MNDLDIIYQIFEDKLYLEPNALKSTVDQIRNHALATGLLVDLACKSKFYKIDPKPIRNIITGNYDFLDAYDSHVEYIDALNKDPRAKLREFIFKADCDLSEDANFIAWIKTLSEKDLSTIERYCVGREYYEVIDFILKTNKGLL